MPSILRGPAGRRRLSPPRLATCGLLLGAALALTGCEQVGVITSGSASSFDSRAGNNPLAAADAASLQSALRLRGQLWTLKLATQPATAGDVDTTNAQSVVAGREKMTSLDLTLTATASSTTQGFSSRGAQGEQAYLEGIIQAIANAGYVRLTQLRLDVWFGGDDHHSTLTWSGSTGFVYKVLDGKP